jgi:hypothetical protein
MTVSALRWFKAALFLQILLVAYWLAVEVLDFFPWNDLASRPTAYDLRWAIAINGLQLLAYTAIFSLGIRPLAVLSALGYAGYLAWHLWIWWKPFALGASAEWRALYGQSFSRTLKVLPQFSDRLAPDAQHLTLQILVLLTLIATVMAVMRMRHL